VEEDVLLIAAGVIVSSFFCSPPLYVLDYRRQITDKIILEVV
jgi:hypothetical protein